MKCTTSVSEKSVVSQEIKSVTKWDSIAETSINNLALRKKTQKIQCLLIEKICSKINLQLMTLQEMNLIRLIYSLHACAVKD